VYENVTFCLFSFFLFFPVFLQEVYENMTFLSNLAMLNVGLVLFFCFFFPSALSMTQCSKSFLFFFSVLNVGLIFLSKEEKI